MIWNCGFSFWAVQRKFAPDQKYLLSLQPPHPRISMLGWIKSSTIVTKSNVNFAWTGTFQNYNIEIGGRGGRQSDSARDPNHGEQLFLHNPDLVNVIFGVTTFFIRSGQFRLLCPTAMTHTWIQQRLLLSIGFAGVCTPAFFCPLAYTP